MLALDGFKKTIKIFFILFIFCRDYGKQAVKIRLLGRNHFLYIAGCGMK